MRRVKSAIAVCLLGLGLSVGLLTAVKLQNQDETGAERHETAIAFVLFGLVPIAGGSYLVWGLQRANQQARRDRLHLAFVHLIKAGNGNVSVLDFSLYTKLPGHQAKIYLDQCARDFNATFDVDDNGGIFYHFAVGDATLNALSASDTATYDVILEAVPGQQREVVRVIQSLTGLNWSEVKALVRNSPSTVGHGLNRATAESYRQQLEAVGATVTIALR